MLSLVLLYSYRDSDETNVAFLAAVRGGPLCEGGRCARGAAFGHGFTHEPTPICSHRAARELMSKTLDRSERESSDDFPQSTTHHDHYIPLF
jgi:hypothetical protein